MYNEYNMNLLFWGLTTGTIGKVMLAVGVLKAHGQIVHEHRIDRKVIKTFKTERWLTIVGLLLIVLGYGMEVYFYDFINLLSCEPGACTAALGEALKLAQ